MIYGNYAFITGLTLVCLVVQRGQRTVDCFGLNPASESKLHRTYTEPTQSKQVENDASARPPNLTSASCDLEVSPSDAQS